MKKLLTSALALCALTTVVSCANQSGETVRSTEVDHRNSHLEGASVTQEVQNDTTTTTTATPPPANRVPTMH